MKKPPVVQPDAEQALHRICDAFGASDEHRAVAIALLREHLLADAREAWRPDHDRGLRSWRP